MGRMISFNLVDAYEVLVGDEWHRRCGGEVELGPICLDRDEMLPEEWVRFEVYEGSGSLCRTVQCPVSEIRATRSERYEASALPFTSLVEALADVSEEDES